MFLFILSFIITATIARIIGLQTGFPVIDKLFALGWDCVGYLFDICWGAIANHRFMKSATNAANSPTFLTARGMLSDGVAQIRVLIPRLFPGVPIWAVLLGLVVVIFITLTVISYIFSSPSNGSQYPMPELLDSIKQMTAPGAFSGRGGRSGHVGSGAHMRSRSPLHRKLDDLEVTSVRTAVALLRELSGDPAAARRRIQRTPGAADAGRLLVDYCDGGDTVGAAEALGDLADALGIVTVAEPPSGYASAEPSPPTRGLPRVHDVRGHDAVAPHNASTHVQAPYDPRDWQHRTTADVYKWGRDAGGHLPLPHGHVVGGRGFDGPADRTTPPPVGGYGMGAGIAVSELGGPFRQGRAAVPDYVSSVLGNQ